MKKGFTLVELLVVVSIIAIISGSGLAVFTQSGKKSRDARRQSDIEIVRNALENYRVDNPAIGYPAAVDYGELISTGILDEYLDPLPADPSLNDYTYLSAGGAAYTLCATLEAGAGGNYCGNPGGAGITPIVPTPTPGGAPTPTPTPIIGGLPTPTPTPLAKPTSTPTSVPTSTPTSTPIPTPTPTLFLTCDIVGGNCVFNGTPCNNPSSAGCSNPKKFCCQDGFID